MQLISKFHKRFRFLLCVFDIFSKYAWAIPLKDKKGITITNGFQKILKDKKGITITNGFQKILKESNRRPKKIWVD